MDRQPEADFNPEAEVCGVGQEAHDIFFDDFENGLSKWTASSNRWSIMTGYAVSGTHMLDGADNDSISDHNVAMAIPVALPSGQSYLHFRHAFGFETSDNSYWDGGVLEYSTDNGATWSDAASLIDSGKGYGGTIYNGANADQSLERQRCLCR